MILNCQNVSVMIRHVDQNRTEVRLKSNITKPDDKFFKCGSVFFKVLMCYSESRKNKGINSQKNRDIKNQRKA